MKEEMVSTELREEVRRHYAAAAEGAACCDSEGQCCGPGVSSEWGSGDPAGAAGLHEGETVLDLGSGAGTDVIATARRLGGRGTAYGLDMTDEMLSLAQRRAREAGVHNAHFLRGRIEDVPLPSASVDVVISNCVVNLSTDKPAVLRETFRVLRPGGRLAISDIVAEDRLDAAARAKRGSLVGCIAGALSVGEYAGGLRDAGFEDVEIELVRPVADGMHTAIVRAVKPSA